MGMVIRKMLLASCAATVAFCGWNIYSYYDDMHDASEKESQLITSVQASDKEAPVSYEELHSRNTDYQGWIWFDSNLISLPIMQTDENDYYLKRNLDKEISLGGTPFIDAANSLTDQNITIYGHTVFMDDSNLVFTPLKSMLDQGTFDENKRFHIAWKDGTKTYQIFAVCNVDSEEDSWEFSQNVFQSDQEFYTFVHEAKKHSSISTDVDVAATDQLITLQTCTELDSTKKVVIVAKEI
jgi:sortase B